SNNYTGYTWDEVLDLYFAQNRFYDPADHRFTQEDPIKDGENWYRYCGNEPLGHIDWNGEWEFRVVCRTNAILWDDKGYKGNCTGYVSDLCGQICISIFAD
ncbi:MAG: RHS repeat-associated core domain-containing protein, partial [Butyricicoccus sp.]